MSPMLSKFHVEESSHFAKKKAMKKMLEILLSPRSRYRIDVESQCQCNEYDYDVE